MRSLGLGIVGTGNIAGGYARSIPEYPEVHLAAATDLDGGRASAFAAQHGCRAHPTLEALLTDPDVDIVVNLTVQHAHHAVSRQALEAGRHVYSEKPMALHPSDARDLLEVATRAGVRLACAPATFMGEAQQAAAAWVRGGRLGTIRAIYADLSHGRIERWHPAPQPFFEVGVLVDVGVYSLSLVTAMVGPARRVRAWGWNLMPERVTLDGTRFEIGSPDFIVAAIELEGGAVVRLGASFYVGAPARFRGGLEFHGDTGSLALGSFQEFDASVAAGPADGEYESLPYPRSPYRGTSWARGVADLASAIAEHRPHRASAEQAAHVVDILDAAARSMANDGRPIEVSSSFEPPALMPWAVARSEPED